MINIRNFGAKPELSDNTAAVQNAIASCATRDTVLIPDGTFLVQGEQLRGRTDVNFQFDGYLTAIPSTAQIYRILVLESVSNVKISGKGGFIGERPAHDIGNPEDMQAHNLAIYESNNIVIDGISSVDARGDNFYLSGVTNVTIQNSLGHHAMRNNLSIIDVDTCNILDNTFQEANGPEPMPMAGIDIEPDRPDQRVRSLIITRNQFIRNKGTGIFFAMGNTQNISNVHVYGNTFDQHYKDVSGPPTKGYKTGLGYFCYSTCRWIPGYDWWFFPKEFSA